MKIIIVDTSGRGGICHYTFFLSRALSSLSEHITLLTTENYELDSFKRTFNIEKKLPAHYKKRNKFLKGLIYVQSLFKILLYIIRKKPDIVHFQQIKIPSLELALYKILKLKNIKTVLTLHDILPFEYKLISPFYKYIYRTVDGIIIHSEKNLSVMQNHISKEDRHKITIIHHGDYSFLSNTIDKADARKTLGIKTNGKVLLFFGYIRKYKGLDLLLEALSIIKDSHPGTMLIIAGETVEEFNKYQNIIDELNLDKFILKKIEYIPLEEQSIYFSAADIVVLPYRHIYQSGVVFLAYAHSLPVIVTDVGGLPDVVEDGKSGFVVPSQNARAIAEKADYLFSNMEMCTQIGNYGSNMAKSKFSWDAAAQKTYHLYNNVIK
ncbi:glycosyltransferase family 4 protein [bacterium]|nr:glycosyltransferase family 4 protein [bacterium]